MTGEIDSTVYGEDTCIDAETTKDCLIVGTVLQQPSEPPPHQHVQSSENSQNNKIIVASVKKQPSKIPSILTPTKKKHLQSNTLGVPTTTAALQNCCTTSFPRGSRAAAPFQSPPAKQQHSGPTPSYARQTMSSQKKQHDDETTRTHHGDFAASLRQYENGGKPQMLSPRKPAAKKSSLTPQRRKLSEKKELHPMESMAKKSKTDNNVPLSLLATTAPPPSFKKVVLNTDSQSKQSFLATTPFTPLQEAAMLGPLTMPKSILSGVALKNQDGATPLVTVNSPSLITSNSKMSVDGAVNVLNAISAQGKTVNQASEATDIAVVPSLLQAFAAQPPTTIIKPRDVVLFPGRLGRPADMSTYNELMTNLPPPTSEQQPNRHQVIVPPSAALKNWINQASIGKLFPGLHPSSASVSVYEKAADEDPLINRTMNLLGDINGKGTEEQSSENAVCSVLFGFGVPQYIRLGHLFSGSNHTAAACTTPTTCHYLLGNNSAIAFGNKVALLGSSSHKHVYGVSAAEGSLCIKMASDNHNLMPQGAKGRITVLVRYHHPAAATQDKVENQAEPRDHAMMDAIGDLEKRGGTSGTVVVRAAGAEGGDDIISKINEYTHELARVCGMQAMNVLPTDVATRFEGTEQTVYTMKPDYTESPTAVNEKAIVQKPDGPNLSAKLQAAAMTNSAGKNGDIAMATVYDLLPTAAETNVATTNTMVSFHDAASETSKKSTVEERDGPNLLAKVTAAPTATTNPPRDEGGLMAMTTKAPTLATAVKKIGDGKPHAVARGGRDVVGKTDKSSDAILMIDRPMKQPNVVGESSAVSAATTSNKSFSGTLETYKRSDIGVADGSGHWAKAKAAVLATVSAEGDGANAAEGADVTTTPIKKGEAGTIIDM